MVFFQGSNHVNKVTVGEAAQIRTAKWLREKGYIAIAIGDASGATQGVMISKVIKDPRNFLFWKWSVATKYIVAKLWMKCDYFGAKKDNWIIHVYGEKNMDEFVEIAKVLAETFNVKIVHVRLEKEEAEEAEHSGP